MQTDKDHIHYMIETEPTMSISKIVNLMKSYTTYHIWKRYPDYLRNISGKNILFGRTDILSAVWETSVYKGYKQDKIEMRGDRAEMSDFPLYLNTVAGGLDRRDQTIGGFSFVVKIYAVPVVEIIG